MNCINDKKFTLIFKMHYSNSLVSSILNVFFLLITVSTNICNYETRVQIKNLKCSLMFDADPAAILDLCIFPLKNSANGYIFKYKVTF